MRIDNRRAASGGDALFGQVGLRGAALAAAVLGLALPSVASATPQISAPSATNAAPSFTFVELDPSVQSFTVSRGSPDCSSVTLLNSDASSPFTDASLATNGSDDGTYCYLVESFDAPGGTGNSLGTDQASILLDATGPSVSFSAGPSSGTRVNADPTYSASASDGASGVASVQLQRQTGPSTWVDVGAAVTAPPYDADLAIGSLPDATYTLRFQATDGVGNTSASSTRP